ncbi:MAG: ABC transporter ATP-binding protein [Verrucomicrobia bacterium]|nr:ABC transporter ATP-binding protein [Verrucomicrobiota bacterium]
MSGALLHVQNLVAGYGTGDILQGVTLEIWPGEMVATVGRNGVGKSTLMKTIIGLLSTRRGSISLKGESITHLRADQRAALGIGYIPQGREIFPELSVEENLMMGETINCAKQSFRYDLVYEYFPILRERRRQVAGTFSGGQQQMLAIGRALVGRPTLLLLDEPSLGIQPSIIQEIGQALLRLNREEELTILLVEQNMRLIEHVAVRAYAMDKGRIVANLTLEMLKDRETLADYLAV